MRKDLLDRRDVWLTIEISKIILIVGHIFNRIWIVRAHGECGGFFGWLLVIS